MKKEEKKEIDNSEKFLKARDEAEQKRKELEKELDDEVHLIFLIAKDETIIGYLQEPELVTKMRCLDLSTLGRYTDASEIILETSLLKDHSDPRLLDKSKKNAKVYLGALMRAQELVQYYKDQSKKN